MSYKRQKTAVLISVVLGLGIYLFYIFGSTLDNFIHSSANAALSLGIFACFLWGFRVPAEKSSKVFQYWFVVFPLAFILILFVVIFSLEQIDGTKEIDPLFKIGLGIAVLTSMGSIMVMVISEKRLARLEKEVFGNKDENQQ